jgi:cytochrome b561
VLPLRKEDEQMIKKAGYIKRSAAFIMKSALFLAMILLPVSTYALTVGEKSPDFHIVTHQGKEISYDRDIKGKKPVYLFFWTTW